MFSDAFPLKLVDDMVFEVECQMITIKEGDVDIGANPSSEDQDEGVEDGAQTVNNVAHSFRLQATSFDKKSYMVHIKDYMKKVKASLEKSKPDQVDAFTKGAQTFVKKALPLIDKGEYDFYTGESMNPDGMVALLGYREDGITPFFIFWKHGLKEVKL